MGIARGRGGREDLGLGGDYEEKEVIADWSGLTAHEKALGVVKEALEVIDPLGRRQFAEALQEWLKNEGGDSSNRGVRKILEGVIDSLRGEG